MTRSDMSSGESAPWPPRILTWRSPVRNHRRPADPRWWMLEETPLDFDFSQAHEGLRHVTTDDLSGDIEAEWADLLIFGQSDYAEGGGASPWITIRKTDGAVCGLDVERDHAVFVFNSSIEGFIQTFALLDRYLGHVHPLPTNIETLVRDIDGDCYPASEWRLLIDYLTAS